MTAYLYVWDPTSRQWVSNDIFDTEEQAREKGRLLWKAGAPGIKIDVIKTVVKEIRNG